MTFESGKERASIIRGYGVMRDYINDAFILRMRRIADYNSPEGMRAQYEWATALNVAWDVFKGALAELEEGTTATDGGLFDDTPNA